MKQIKVDNVAEFLIENTNHVDVEELTRFITNLPEISYLNLFMYDRDGATFIAYKEREETDAEYQARLERAASYDKYREEREIERLKELLAKYPDYETRHN